MIKHKKNNFCNVLSNVLLKVVCYLKVCFFQNHNQTVLVAKPNQTVNETKPKSGPRGGACIDPINTGPLMSRSIQIPTLSPYKDRLCNGH